MASVQTCHSPCPTKIERTTALRSNLAALSSPSYMDLLAPAPDLCAYVVGCLAGSVYARWSPGIDARSRAFIQMMKYATSQLCQSTLPDLRFSGTSSPRKDDNPISSDHSLLRRRGLARFSVMNFRCEDGCRILHINAHSFRCSISTSHSGGAWLAPPSSKACRRFGRVSFGRAVVPVVHNTHCIPLHLRDLFICTAFALWLRSTSLGVEGRSCSPCSSSLNIGHWFNRRSEDLRIFAPTFSRRRGRRFCSVHSIVQSIYSL